MLFQLHAFERSKLRIHKKHIRPGENTYRHVSVVCSYVYFGFQQVRLHFLRFRLEGSSNCEYDKVNIYDGSDDTAPLIRSFCGSRSPGDIMASGNVVFVSFLSDGTITNSGFRIQYRAPLKGIIELPV